MEPEELGRKQAASKVHGFRTQKEEAPSRFLRERFVVSLSKIWAYAGLVEQRAKFVPPKPVHELSE